MASENKNQNFIEEIITKDLENGTVKGVITRFPPEPNGYLHIGHAKSICLNFGMAEQFGGKCNLRFDDTNPAKEETEYVEAIMADVKWLGFDWAELRYASDYFEQFYEWALELIRAGKAYVDDQNADEIRANRGTLTRPGVDSPYRNRGVEENLALFAKMTAGEFEEGSHVLRAKIDMASSNLNLRDPVIYRILKREHHRTGAKWCVYPMYDFAHGYEDAIEGVTHSICTLEFQDHRPLYDWFIANVDVPHVPHQYEFARLNLTYTVMSKRKLLELVSLGIVDGWDDPRMPTISGFRRRGYTASAIRRFCREIGVAKADSMVEVELLQHCLREELNKTARRGMAVLKPLKVVLENWPEGFVDELPAENNPEDAGAGSRTVKIGKELYIERDDFMEEPVKGFFRLSPGKEVRLKHAYIIRCNEAVKDAAGNVTELRCSVDMESRGGDAPDGRKIKGTLHWVWAGDAVKAKVNLYGHLFTLRNMNDMEEGKDYKDYLDPQSLVVAEEALVEPSLAQAAPLDKFQFLRHGYFCADNVTTPERPVFNLTVSLKDSWGREQKKQ
ncbi:glutamine--tRNA ligase/YqeY domain fusion protein [Cloacibacillus evryensis]|uniref:Glutamine--tRNA ligase n=2 Tax=root TaxID=1 RepID=A0AAW5K6S4_9BACT|nr:glutamine--tRNA ligase/YqeY domain fusion protein [Cloacibacillus evryensis]EHL69020.1 glutamine-tRNA ligase [Synergistes sp. 3_1_syn1]MCQ4763203.1 glutamine--tRNA ligase/YqeY domain fusion protein [Cloacibacillus evryensis]MCQ4815461.1 glutamine--tRNA ligase/YqeY domain fusion protein [Cloacibacillus evryensis]MEA5036494.1 glutamine--tRNA ligase/YqeY domain fusion protein [Cloacibacillus evryensis]